MSMPFRVVIGKVQDDGDQALVEISLQTACQLDIERLRMLPMVAKYGTRRSVHTSSMIPIRAFFSIQTSGR
jgi:hypothetical protein